MITARVDDHRLTVDGRADGPAGDRARAVAAFLVDAMRLWGCAVRARDGYAEVDLPPPGDPVREFVVAGLRELARQLTNALEFVEAESWRRP